MSDLGIGKRRSSERLSIGVVCYRSVGGSGIVASELAAGLTGRGHDVHLIASAQPSRTLPQHDRLFHHEVSVSDYPLFDQTLYPLALASTIVGVVRTHGLDLLHVHYAVPHCASAYLARQVLGDAAPCLVTTLHGTDVTRFGADPNDQSVTRFTVVASDALTVPSEFLKSEAKRVFGLTGEPPVEVIANFVDTDRFTPPARRDPTHFDELFRGAHSAAEGARPTLFHVSTFRPVKRVADLISVLARLRRHVPARLVLVGDGPEQPTAARYARELGVAESVRFLGMRDDFADDLRHADAFLLPSESESFGVAALEALSAGVPVFGYRVGGLPEVVSDGVGRLVEPFDIEALAAAVREVVTDPGRRNVLGGAARAHALAHFRREPALDRYEACFRRVLDARAGEKGERS